MPIANPLTLTRQPTSPNAGQPASPNAAQQPTSLTSTPDKRAKRSQRGAVTAELAITLPVLLSLLLLGIWSIGLVVLNIQCIDAARDVARAVARGESPDQARAIGDRTIPTATITITREGPDIHVTVTAKPAHNPPLLGPLSPAHLSAEATLQAEPTEAEPTEAEPTEADPTEADPTEADPTEADPTEADATEADRTEADRTEEMPAEGAPIPDKQLEETP
jgi:hypothetical protein